MKPYCRVIALLLLCLLLGGCAGAGAETVYVDTTAWLNMNLDYPVADMLPDGEGKPVKVILLLGQSNATGCSLTSYLEKGVSPDKFASFAAGYPDVWIAFSMDDQKYSSQGAFLPTGLNAGAGEGYFGPELGMAEILSDVYGEETVVILKFSMSGYSLHHHWLCNRQRGSIYEACMVFVRNHMDYLLQKHYNAKIGAICWMQGESDTTDYKASHYFDNQVALVSYLREDLAAYAEEGGICFIDAGISDSPYCLPAYPAINEAKERFAALSPLNYYFSTIDAGFTTLYEPVENPDLGHYDARSQLELGRIFGRYIVESYEKRN